MWKSEKSGGIKKIAIWASFSEEDPHKPIRWAKSITKLAGSLKC